VHPAGQFENDDLDDKPGRKIFMKLSTALLIISWIPILQLQLIQFGGESIWIFFLIGLPLIGMWLLIKHIPKNWNLNIGINPVLLTIVFFSIILFGIPIFYGLRKIFEIDLNVFSYPWTFSLIFSIISVGISCTALVLAWREIQEKDKPYIPIFKFILASIFFLWQMNLGLHLYFHLPLDLMQSSHGPIRDIIPGMEPDLALYFNLNALAAFGYVILNFLLFGWMFFKGRFKERQDLFFSSTGLLVITGLFALLFIMVNSTHLIPDSPDHLLRHLTVIPISFISIIGPVLMIAMVLVFFGGILSFFKKRSRRSRFWGVVPKKSLVISLLAVILYVLLFKTIWPIKDPAPGILFRVVKNRIGKLPGKPSGGLFYMAAASYFEFLSYGKGVVMPLVNKLDDDEALVRGLSAEFLLYIGDHRAVQPLIKALQDRDKEVRLKAASALVYIKDPRAIKPLLQVLEKNELDYYTIKNLGKWADPRFIEPLLEKLDDEDEELRKFVIYALGDFKDTRVVEKLIEQLRKEKASEVIGAINRELKSIFGLFNYLEDKNKDAQWWQQWWEHNREKIIKKWKTN
jgi:hypothetical protein